MRKQVATSDHPLQGRRGSLFFYRLAFVVFLFSALWFTFHTITRPDGVRMRDFLSPYTGSRCLWHGCDPYDPQQIQLEFARAGGLAADHPAWNLDPPVYPPSTLVVLLPWSFLPYHAARAAWCALTVVLVFFAMLAVISLTAKPYQPWLFLLAAWTYASEPVELLFSTGQPSGVAISLAIFSLWLVLRERMKVTAILCLGFSLALKPQLAGLFFVYFLLRPRLRVFALKAGALAAVGLLAGIVLLWSATGSSHWLSEYRAQLAASQAPGAVNDPSPGSGYALQFTSAQSLFALIDNSPKVDGPLALALGLAFFIPWLIAARSKEKPGSIHLEAIAAIVCIGMLPVYHRDYDLLLLTVSFPVLVSLAAKKGALTIPALVCTLCLFSSPHAHHTWGRLGRIPQKLSFVTNEHWRAVIFTRWQPVLLAFLACTYLAAMYKSRRTEH